MYIDGQDLKPIRQAAPFEGGTPSWEAAAALIALGVTPDTNMAAVRAGGRIDVIARVGEYLVVVTTESAEPNWWRSIGVTPDDLSVSAGAYPLAAVRSITLEDVHHTWMDHGSLTRLTGTWVIDVDGLSDPIRMPVHTSEEEANGSHFVQRLIADRA